MTQAQVAIEVTEGSCRGQRFEFEEQDSFMIGRGPDCKCVVQNDNTFSRHHLFLEINQSNVVLKDLGSLNGTKVNGKPIYTGRGKSVDPSEADASAPIGLRDGDRIEAGNNVMVLRIIAPVTCVDCEAVIAEQDKKACEFVNGTYLCLACRKREEEKEAAKKNAPAAAKPKPELKMNPMQRQAADRDPAAVVDELLRAFMQQQGTPGAPMTIKGYNNFTEIGRGGFGAVYKAQREQDGQWVAIKTMLQTRRPERMKMLLFDREKEIVSQLKHPNIVASEVSGVWDDIHYIEMEFVDGGSLHDLMNKGRSAIPLKTAAPLILQMLEGLAYAHDVEVEVTTRNGKQKQRGVVHRDLKPPNVLLSRSNGTLTAKLTDFGLAKAFGAAGFTMGAITKTGTACGSPPYMAPEHLVNYRMVKPPTDVYELAATIFHMLTGQFIRPMLGRDPFKCVLEEPARRLKDCLPGCPAGLNEVMERALAPKPQDRYPNGREMLAAMKSAL
jgi:eukaryotic-like serine/threonine-protein kinase